MTAVRGQLAPIPGAQYGAGTMTVADIYASHAGIGGIRTQDYTIPAFGDRMAANAAPTGGIGGLAEQVSLKTPAGWLALMLVALLVLVLLDRGR